MTSHPSALSLADGKMLYRRDGAVGWLTVNNPERHNACSLDMWEAILEILKAAEADAALRVLVLTGAGGRAFVSGADISKFEEERAQRDAIGRYDRTTEEVFEALHLFPKPTVAMIRGWCIGGGMGIAVSCDLRLCTHGSRFGVPASKLGLGYGADGVRRLVDVVGPSFAKEIFYTARHYDAGEAKEMGLVNRVVSDEEIEALTQEYAQTIARNAPMTIRAVKATITELSKDPDAREMSEVNRLVVACMDSADYVEGRRAFMEKRAPVFKDE
ncbi:MAG: enoyl-CoA hydratase [Elsteraceae bacterium]